LTSSDLETKQDIENLINHLTKAAMIDLLGIETFYPLTLPYFLHEGQKVQTLIQIWIFS